MRERGLLRANLGDDEREISEEIEDVERALGMDGGIPKTTEEFLRRVSSRAYGMRRDLQQTIDSISYDGEFLISSRISSLIYLDWCTWKYLVDRFSESVGPFLIRQISDCSENSILNAHVRESMRKLLF